MAWSGPREVICRRWRWVSRELWKPAKVMRSRRARVIVIQTYKVNRLLVQVGNQIPQHVPFRRLEQYGPLPDTELIAPLELALRFAHMAVPFTLLF